MPMTTNQIVLLEESSEELVDPSEESSPGRCLSRVRRLRRCGRLGRCRRFGRIARRVVARSCGRRNETGSGPTIPAASRRHTNRNQTRNAASVSCATGFIAILMILSRHYEGISPRPQGREIPAAPEQGYARSHRGAGTRIAAIPAHPAMRDRALPESGGTPWRTLGSWVDAFTAVVAGAKGSKNAQDSVGVGAWRSVVKHVSRKDTHTCHQVTISSWYVAAYSDATSAQTDFQTLKDAEGDDLEVVGAVVMSRDADGNVDVLESGAANEDDDALRVHGSVEALASSSVCLLARLLLCNRYRCRYRCAGGASDEEA